MAILRVQEKIKKADGTYDVVHKETEAGLVLFDDNETFQQKYDAGELNGKDGKSPYQQAVEGGYTGTEAEFKAMLASGPWLPTSGGGINGTLNLNNSGTALNFPYPHGPQNINVQCGELNFTGPTGESVILRGIKTPLSDNNAANKKYVDDTVASAGSGSNNNNYGTCSTASSTATKVVSLTGFTLKTGAAIWVKFTNTNTATTPSLNVNNTGAKQIKKYGTTAPNSYMWMSGAVVGFVYDGTYWIMVDGTTATTSYYGVTKLNSSVSSASTTEAATPSAVKAAYDLASSALQKTGGDMTGNIDMQNNVITGLPNPTAPSDAVNYQTLINAVAGIDSFAIATVTGDGHNGNTVTKKAAISITSVTTVGNDTIISLAGTVSDINTVIKFVTGVTVVLPTQFKYPSSDWSAISGYSALRAVGDSNQTTFSLGGSSVPLTFNASASYWSTSKIVISGHVRVGVNA